MATNELFRDGAQLSLPVPADTPSGAPVKVGILTGVTLTKEGEGGNGDGYATVRLAPGPVHNVSVTGAITAIGQAVYIDSSNALTATVGSNTLFGAALALKAAGAAAIPVKII